MCKIHKKDITSFDEYFSDICGRHILLVVKFIISAFMLCSLSVMFAAGGAILLEKFGLNISVGSLLIGAVTYVVLIYGISGVIRANVVMAPLLIVGMLFFALYILYFKGAPAFAVSFGWAKPIFDNWCSKAIIYASYNSITLAVVLTSLYKLINKKSTAVCASVVSGGILCAVMSFLLTVEFLFYHEIKTFEIPFLYIAAKSGNIVESIYITVMFLAILTASCANGHGAVKIIFNEKKFPTPLAALAVCTAAYALSLFGFSALVSKAYTTFGYFGLFISAMVFIDGVKYIKGK